MKTCKCGAPLDRGFMVCLECTRLALAAMREKMAQPEVVPPPQPCETPTPVLTDEERKAKLRAINFRIHEATAKRWAEEPHLLSEGVILRPSRGGR